MVRVDTRLRSIVLSAFDIVHDVRTKRVSVDDGLARVRELIAEGKEINPDFNLVVGKEQSWLVLGNFKRWRDGDGD